ncbi:hypothetical protein ERHA54_05590 [Erwinia rhapontici]|uniref:Uncharacterized protein n=1 Tax=Erwinia rhapontici TaxID=55212 RepID=A0ABM7MVG5_ERWRD|nr:hypothetical protein [Erwinia rhapontici]MCS3606656.1 hypothetical protein [Erwinia rhapontici]TDS99457.1 hypothetical protein EDF84_104307 [Erwinia rhapontici]BCQ33182.1 hypothetical protein ERHA53_05250 [Erwinia rhapontici]BCQ37956.1 hypothetical protein ERHA54_05590 [Erwinia rhapontici]
MLLILIKGRVAAFFLSLQNLSYFEDCKIKDILLLRFHIPHRHLGF